MVGGTAFELVAVTAPEQAAQVREALKQQSCVTIECEARRRDGTLLPVEVALTRLPDGHTLAVVRSIAERKRAEAALRQSEEKFARLFHASPVATTLSRLDNGQSVRFRNILGLKYSRLFPHFPFLQRWLTRGC